MTSTKFDIDLRRRFQPTHDVSDVENVLNEHIENMIMCPAIVVFTDEWECEMFSYYYSKAVICKLMKKIALEDELGDENAALGNLMSALYNSPDMHSITIAFYKLAMMYKDKRFNIGDAMIELDSVDVDSIDSVFSAVRVWADKPVREAAIKIIQRGIMQSALFERAMIEGYKPPDGRAFVRAKRDYDDFYSGR